MKKKYWLLSLTLFFVHAQSYGQGHEKLHVIKLGVDGFFYSLELDVSNKLSLNFEVGGSIGLASKKVSLNPVVQLEPRYYYNLGNKSNTEINHTKATSFICITTGIYPNFIFNNQRTSPIFVVPKWGIKKQISKALGR